MRFAIIDMGTNTFNLLIVDKKNNDFSILFKTKKPVKLGQNVANTNLLCNEAINRGIEAIKQHIETAKKYKVDSIYAYATSAIRSTENGNEFVNKIQEQFGIKPKIISGDEEAKFIYLGVKKAVQLTEDKYLIIDIGGGSIEIIIANKDTIFWKQSFRLGIARLLDLFHPSDPVTKAEIENIENHICNNTKSLHNAIKEHPVSTLIGSSGSFDTFAKMISRKSKPAGFLKDKISFEIDLKEYAALHEELIKSTSEQRKNMKGLEPMRVEMIVLASIFVNFIIKKYNIKKLIQSDYALKEGVISII